MKAERARACHEFVEQQAADAASAVRGRHPEAAHPRDPRTASTAAATTFPSTSYQMGEDARSTSLAVTWIAYAASENDIGTKY